MMNTQIQGMFLGSTHPMKIQHGRGLERNGAKVSKGAVLWKRWQWSRDWNLGNRRKAGKRATPPRGWWPYPGMGGGMDKGHPATQGSLLHRESGRCA